MNKLRRGTVEYVAADVSVLVDDADPAELTMPVELSLSRGSVDNWLPAVWDGDVTVTQRTADPTIPVGKKRLTSRVRTASVITINDDYPHPAYTLAVRFTENPEIPEVAAGMLYILGKPTTPPVPSTPTLDDAMTALDADPNSDFRLQQDARLTASIESIGDERYAKLVNVPTNVSYLDLPTSGCWTAHSGSKRSGLPIAPEQSMSAYRLAYALGAPILDIDYRRTRDGVLIGIHDADTSAVSDVNVTVASTAYAYMPQIHHPLDVGAGWAAEDHALLTDLLNEFGGKVILTIEAKGGVPDVAPLAALIHDRGLADSVYINSGDSTVLAAIVAAGCLPHGFGAYTTAHFDSQATAMGASVGKGIVEVPIDANAALIDHVAGKGFWRMVAGPVNSAGVATSITKFSQLAGIDARVHGFVNDALGYLGRPGGEGTRSADTIADAVRTGKRPPGTRIVNSAGGTWMTTSGIELKTPTGGRSVVLGSVSGTPAASGSVTMKFKMTTLPGTTGEGFRLCALMTDEAPTNVAADAGRTGYVISLSAAGTLNLWTMVGGVRTAVGAAVTGAALVAGTEYAVKFEWTPTTVKATRVDTGGTTGDQANTDWRGRYLGAYTTLTSGQAYLTDVAVA